MIRILVLSLPVVLITSTGCSNKPATFSPSAVLENTASPSDESASIERPCVPRPVRNPNTYASMQMRPGGALPSVCLVESKEGDRMTASETCWHVDDKGLVALLPKPPSTLFKQSFNGDAKWHIDSSDGRYRAVIGDTHIDISELATNTIVSHIPKWSDEHNDGVSASADAGYFLGDTLFLIDHDAGPHADVIGFRTGGNQPGTVADEVYNGSTSILDEHRAAFVGPALTRITVYDTRTHKRTEYTRLIPPSDVCTQDQTNNYLVETDYECGEDVTDGAEPRCCQHLAKTLGRYIRAEVGMLPDGRFLVALNGADLGRMTIYDPTTKTLTDEFSLFCDE